MYIKILTVFICFATLAKVNAQTSDTSESVYIHSPKKAIILSAALPSAGQFYNRKYWKMPIVLGGLAVSTYFIVDNTRNFNNFRREYLNRLEGKDPSENFELYDTDDLRLVADTYERWKDLSYISFGVIYLLQIIDAAVDAHFFDWEEKMNENLSLRVTPHSNFSQKSIGLKLTLKL